MAKHSVYQIKKANRELASLSVFYGISNAFTQADARLAFREGRYEKTADVEATDSAQVKKLINGSRDNPLILRTGLLRNIGVGDLLNNTETGQWFIVGPERFDLIKIKVR
jgi:hypothetical protein